jgi:hypothetical protein
MLNSIIQQSQIIDNIIITALIMILTLDIKRGIGIRILRHNSDFELKNAPQVYSVKKSSDRHQTFKNQLCTTSPISSNWNTLIKKNNCADAIN